MSHDGLTCKEANEAARELHEGWGESEQRRLEAEADCDRYREALYAVHKGLGVLQKVIADAEEQAVVGRDPE